MNTIARLLTSALLLCLLGCTDSGESDIGAPADLPMLQAEQNILIVSFDALRTDVLGIYGNQRGLTPNIDRWAESAIVFDNFYTAGQATPTSFAAAFTGQYPHRSFRGWKLEETQTLAKVMQRSGFKTFGIFNNVQLVDERNFGQGFETYEVLQVAPDPSVAEQAHAMLAEHKDGRFFGWVHFISPHTPYVYREDAKHLYTPGYEGEYVRSSGRQPNPESEADAKRIKELYDGEVWGVDQLFQTVINSLEQLGLADNTLVILTADHGEAFNDHGTYGHKVLYDEVIRIPFIMAPPQYMSQQRVSNVHLNTDILPTLATMVGAEYVPTRDGVPMQNQPDEDLARIFTAMTNSKYRAMAIRQQGMKMLIECPPEEYVEYLFDLRSDPGELNDIILDHPDSAEELFDQLEDMIGGTVCETIVQATKGVEIENDLDAETIEKLRSLGYIQ